MDAERDQQAQIMVLGGQAGAIALTALLYGLYELYVLGTGREFWLETYFPLLGSVITAVGVLAFAGGITSKARQPWRFLTSMGGMLGYLFSLYLFGVLGMYRLYSLLYGFSAWTLIAGVFWIWAGYKMLYAVWLLSEVGVSPGYR